MATAHQWQVQACLCDISASLKIIALSFTNAESTDLVSHLWYALQSKDSDFV